MYEEECSEILRELLKLSSQEASLRFKLFELTEAAKVEIIRLSGLAAECDLFDAEAVKEIRERLDRLFKKYVVSSK